MQPKAFPSVPVAASGAAAASPAGPLAGVNQIRSYRNGDGHGRREGAIDMSDVIPRAAYERLKEFLEVLGITAPTSRFPLRIEAPGRFAMPSKDRATELA